MFFDFRLWALTKNSRRHCPSSNDWRNRVPRRNSPSGLLGWLLSKVFNGSTFSDLLGPTLLVGIVMIVRGS